MSDPTRARIKSAFDEELSSAPAPDGLRALSVRAAVTAPRQRTPRPELLALVAAVLALALIATLVLGANALRHNPSPARIRPGPSVVPPTPRSDAAMVFDQAHGELVLFGGTDITGKTVNETWTWDGKSWRLYHLAVAPSPRTGAAMAYDPTHKDVVLFGGLSNLDDTWTWDGSAWVRRHPAHAPALSSDWPASMVNAPAEKTVILYGFRKEVSGNQTSMVAETWSWNGSDWIQVTTQALPSQSGQLIVVGQNVVLLSPAPQRIRGRYLWQWWEWDGTSWRLQPSPAFELRTVPAAAAFDPRLAQVVMFNGDTWIADGAGWRRVHPTTQPGAVGYMAYFEPLHEVVMWGSLYGDTANDLWAWDGSDWHQLAPGTMPPAPAPSGQLGPATPVAAFAFIRQNTTRTSPVLLPAYLPAGIEATRVIATPDEFDLDLASDQRDKTIFLGTVAANPPPGDERSSDTRVRFRQASALKYGAPGYAEYFVYDPASPLSDRWLAWIEPGTMSVQGSPSQGVWYFLSASGMTDAEFWQVANSLR